MKGTEHFNGNSAASGYALRGDLCFSKSPTELFTIEGGYVVCVDGICQGVFASLPPEYAQLPVRDYSGKLIFPGLVDLHIHAPQYAFRGLGMDMELMEWLQNQAFPEEAKYADPDYACKAYDIFAETMRSSATTHACIFATRHRAATELLMKRMEQTGIISYVGKVNMDRGAPDILREPSPEASALETIGWLEDAQGKYQRTKPILTPRFIPSCTQDLLERLREIQTAYDLPVQSHLSENPEEIETVRRLCPEAEFYGDAYDRFGLFGRQHPSERPVRTVMAHCVYSGQREIRRMKENGVFVAHCPASNTNLASGIAPIRTYMTEGMKIGLGSDVAGGHTESMLRAVCDAVQVSKLRWRLVDPSWAPLTFREAFYLATKGGGEFFGNVGSFEKGCSFSAVVLDDTVLRRPFALTLPQRLEQAAYSSLDLGGVCAKYVAGEKLFDHT